jgi:hypothetical protein
MLLPSPLSHFDMQYCAGILEQCMGARERVEIGLSYRPARLLGIVFKNNGHWFSLPPEHIFVNVWGAQESIPPAYVAWRAGTSNRVVAPARQTGNRFLGSLKSFQIRAHGFIWWKSSAWLFSNEGYMSVQIIRERIRQQIVVWSASCTRKESSSQRIQDYLSFRLNNYTSFFFACDSSSSVPNTSTTSHWWLCYQWPQDLWPWYWKGVWSQLPEHIYQMPILSQHLHPVSHNWPEPSNRNCSLQWDQW